MTLLYLLFPDEGRSISCLTPLSYCARIRLLSAWLLAPVSDYSAWIMTCYLRRVLSAIGSLVRQVELLRNKATFIVPVLDYDRQIVDSYPFPVALFQIVKNSCITTYREIE